MLPWHTLNTVNVQAVQTFCDCSVLNLYFKYLPPTLPQPPNFCLCQSEMPSVFQREMSGGGGEAVSSGSTWLWNSLDQAPGLDMNRERSSHHTTQLVTLLQDRLTDNALTVSLPDFECPLKTGRYRRVK